MTTTETTKAKRPALRCGEQMKLRRDCETLLVTLIRKEENEDYGTRLTFRVDQTIGLLTKHARFDEFTVNPKSASGKALLETRSASSDFWAESVRADNLRSNLFSAEASVPLSFDEEGILANAFALGLDQNAGRGHAHLGQVNVRVSTDIARAVLADLLPVAFRHPARWQIVPEDEDGLHLGESWRDETRIPDSEWEGLCVRSFGQARQVLASVADNTLTAKPLYADGDCLSTETALDRLRAIDSAARERIAAARK